MFSTLVNSLILNRLFKCKELRDIHALLAGVLACTTLFSTLVAQVPLVVLKIYILADIWQDNQSSFCRVVWLSAHGGRLAIQYSLTCVLSITIDRYIAVVHPHYFLRHKTFPLKVIAWVLPFQTIHVVMNIVFKWYTPFAQVIGVLQIVGAFIFAVVTYVKISKYLTSLAEPNAIGKAITVAKQKQRVWTSILVFLVFFVCYFPIIILQIIGMTSNSYLIDNYIKPLFVTLLFTSSSINAVIYGFRNARLGKAMKAQLKRAFRILPSRIPRSNKVLFRVSVEAFDIKE